MPRRNEIKPLTGIRSIAALWVFLYHLKADLTFYLPDFSWIIEVLVGRGYLGVDLFFTLSGFILAYNYNDSFKEISSKQYRGFLWLRLARIYPVHLFTILLFALAVLTANVARIPLTTPEFFNTTDFIKNLFLIQAWSVPVEASWNTLAWSVSCEWLAYLALPLCLFLFRGRNKAILIFSYVLLSAVLVSITNIFNFQSTFSYGSLRIAIEFNLGIIAYYLYKTGLGRRLSWNIGLGLIFGAFILIGCLSMKKELPFFLMAPFFGVIILGLAYESCCFSRYLSCNPFVYGGYISYSFYMIHELVLLVAKKAHPLIQSNHIQFSGCLWILFQFSITLLAAILIHHFIEEPFRLHMRRLYPKRYNYA